MIISISGKIGSGKDLVGKIIQGLTIGQDALDYWEFDNSYEFTKAWLTTHKSMAPSKSNKLFTIQKFGGVLKDCICILLGCTREQLEDREFKEKELGEEWWYYNINNELYSYLEWKDIITPTINYSNLPIKKLTPRLLLQLLGTEAGRNIIHPDIWCNALMSKYTQKDNWVITDNRFINEFRSVKFKQGITIRIERDFNLRFPKYKNLKEVELDDKELYKQLTHYSETSLDNFKDWDDVVYNNGNIQDLILEIQTILINYNIL